MRNATSPSLSTLIMAPTLYFEWLVHYSKAEYIVSNWLLLGRDVWWQSCLLAIYRSDNWEIILSWKTFLALLENYSSSITVSHVCPILVVKMNTAPQLQTRTTFLRSF